MKYYGYLRKNIYSMLLLAVVSTTIYQYIRIRDLHEEVSRLLHSLSENQRTAAVQPPTPAKTEGSFTEQISTPATQAVILKKPTVFEYQSDNIKNVYADAAAKFDSAEFQTALTRDIKTAIESRYRSFFEKANLTPSDITKLVDLLAEKQMRAIDVLRAAQSNDMTPSRDHSEILNLLTKSQSDVDQNIQDFLGPNRFKDLQGFTGNLPTMALLGQIESRMANSGFSLSGEQQNGLRSVLVGTVRQPVSSSPETQFFLTNIAESNPFLAATLQPQITPASIQSAGAILSPDQLKILKALQAEQQARQTVVTTTRPSPTPTH